MAKITPPSIDGDYSTQIALKEMMRLVEDNAQKFLYRDNPLREPNHMENDIDMQGNNLIVPEYELDNSGGLTNIVDTIPEYVDRVDAVENIIDLTAESAIQEITLITQAQPKSLFAGTFLPSPTLPSTGSGSYDWACEFAVGGFASSFESRQAALDSAQTNNPGENAYPSSVPHMETYVSGAGTIAYSKVDLQSGSSVFGNYPDEMYNEQFPYRTANKMVSLCNTGEPTRYSGDNPTPFTDSTWGFGDYCWLGESTANTGLWTGGYVMTNDYSTTTYTQIRSNNCPYADVDNDGIDEYPQNPPGTGFSFVVGIQDVQVTAYIDWKAPDLAVASSTDLVEWPYANGWYVDLNGDTTKAIRVKDASQVAVPLDNRYYKALKINIGGRGATLAVIGHSTVLRDDDPDYNNQAYWESLYGQAVNEGYAPAGWTYGIDYPEEVQQRATRTGKHEQIYTLTQRKRPSLGRVEVINGQREFVPDYPGLIGKI